MKQLLLVVAFAPILFGQTGRFGLPACDGPGQELADRRFFVVCHSASHKLPIWVGYELTAAHLEKVAPRPSHFRADNSLAASGATNADYRGSGFSRGHLAPAADFAWSLEAIRATFLLSNVIPQNQAVNVGCWSQIEAATRRLATRADAVYIVTGVLFESIETERIGPGRVAVPSHTFKVILSVKGDEKIMLAFIVPNDPAAARAPLDSFATSVEEVERRSHLGFFRGPASFTNSPVTPTGPTSAPPPTAPVSKT